MKINLKNTITAINIILLIIFAFAMSDVAYADPFPGGIEILTQYGNAPFASAEAEGKYKKNVVFINKDGFAYADAELMAGILGGNMTVDMKSGTCDFSVGDGNWYTATVGLNKVDIEPFEGLKSTISLNHAPVMSNGKLCLPIRDFAEKVWGAKVDYKYDGLHKIFISVKD